LTDKLTRSEQWDKEEKSPFHHKDFLGTEKAVRELLSILNHASSYPVTIEIWYMNPWHHFGAVKHSEKKIDVYMDGYLLDY